MDKRAKIAFGLLLLVVVFLTYLEASEPQPVNWNPSYQEKDKIALGSYILYESWINDTPVDLENVSVPPFEFLDQDVQGTYFFLNDVVAFDDSELKKLLSWVEKGNSTFISAGYISKNLLDTLNLKATTYSAFDNFVSRPTIKLEQPQPKDDYSFNFDIEALYFNNIDTINHKVLGTFNFAENNASRNINFIKVGFGKGEFLLHSTPEALSNYFLLTNQNYKYAEGVLASVNPKNKVYWDNYYKAGKTFYTSPLYILLNNKSLKWAYYFVLFGSLLFILFEGKRKQRPVPVIVPLKNQTYEYAGTVAQLFIEQRQYKALAIKKIAHFNEYIRSRFRLDTSVKDDKFFKELAGKSDNEVGETKILFNTFSSITSKEEISKNELQDLNDRIRAYKKTE